MKKALKYVKETVHIAFTATVVFSIMFVWWLLFPEEDMDK